MNYLSILLGIALLGAITTSAIYRADAADAKAELIEYEQSSLKADIQARADALAQEAKDKAALETQSSKAIQQAQSQAQQAQNQLKSYQAKLAAAATVKDLGHRCAGVEIPKDLIP